MFFQKPQIGKKSIVIFEATVKVVVAVVQLELQTKTFLQIFFFPTIRINGQKLKSGY